MIFGFPAHPTVHPGDDLLLHVSTDAPRFRVDFHRCGVRLEPVGRSDWLDGTAAPPHLPYQDWARDGIGLRGEHLPAWPGYRFPVPAGWPPGVYLAVLVEDGGLPAVPERPDARHGQALFVVRGRTPASRLLYKLPLLTYHAYNQVTGTAYHPALAKTAPCPGGWCLYTLPAPEDVPVPVPPSVGVRRPGGGTGGTPWDIFNTDPFDTTPRQTFVHWDWPFIRWLEGNGYRADYCTDLDLHAAGTDLLDGYRLLLSVGHDEYWTDAMRDGVEWFVDGGGNAAFFSGNTCWWRVAMDDEFSYRRVRNWSERPEPDRPENALTGVSFRNGGERDLDDHPQPVGYQVQHADHWVYDGTGVGDGDTFGDRPGEYLVGYECDGAHFDRAQLGRSRPVRPTGDDGTPRGFTILGVGDVSASGWGLGNKAATLGVHTRGAGTVFTAATTDWARVLAGGASPVVERITANVLQRLG